MILAYLVFGDKLVALEYVGMVLILFGMGSVTFGTCLCRGGVARWAGLPCAPVSSTAAPLVHTHARTHATQEITGSKRRSRAPRTRGSCCSTTRAGWRAGLPCVWAPWARVVLCPTMFLNSLASSGCGCVDVFAAFFSKQP